MCRSRRDMDDVILLASRTSMMIPATPDVTNNVAHVAPTAFDDCCCMRSMGGAGKTRWNTQGVFNETGCIRKLCRLLRR